MYVRSLVAPLVPYNLNEVGPLGISGVKISVISKNDHAMSHEMKIRSKKPDILFPKCLSDIPVLRTALLSGYVLYCYRNIILVLIGGKRSKNGKTKNRLSKIRVFMNTFLGEKGLHFFQHFTTFFIQT